MNTKDTNPKDAIGETKVSLSLLSPIAKAQWALAQFCGKTKYGNHNWRVSGVRSSIYLDAIDRHRDAYLSGEELDPVDGTHHLGNIMACCAIILDAAAAGKLVDDRPPSVSLRSTYAMVERGMAKLKTQYADKTPIHYYIGDTQPPAAPKPLEFSTSFVLDPEVKEDPAAWEKFKELLTATTGEGAGAKALDIEHPDHTPGDVVTVTGPEDEKPIAENGRRVLITPPPVAKFREGDVVRIRYGAHDEEGTVKRVGLCNIIVTESPTWPEGGGFYEEHLTLLRRPVQVGDVLRAGPSHDSYEHCECIGWRNSVIAVHPYGLEFAPTEFDDDGNPCDEGLVSPYAHYAHADGTPIESPAPTDNGSSEGEDSSLDSPACGAV